MVVRFIDEEEEPISIPRKSRVRFVDEEPTSTPAPSRVRFLDDSAEGPGAGTPSLGDTISQALPAPFNIANQEAFEGVNLFRGFSTPSQDPQRRAAQRFAGEAVAPTVPIVGDLARTQVGQRVIGSTAQGILGTVSGTAAAIPALETKIGVETPIGRKAEEAANKVRNFASKLAPDDPTFADALASGAGSMATFMLPGLGAAGTVAKIPRFAKLATKLGPAIGTSVATVVESATEAGSVFQDQIEKGIDRAKSANDAFQDFWANTLIIGLTNRFGLFGAKGSQVARAVKSAPLEAIQEGAQEVTASVSKDEPINWNSVAQAAGVGGIIGGGAALVIPGEVITGEKPPAPSLEESIDALEPTAQEVASPQPTTPPPQFTFTEQSVGTQGFEYITRNLPELSIKLNRKSFPVEPEVMQDALKKTMAKREEILIRGGTQQDAKLAALNTFNESLGQIQAQKRQDFRSEDILPGAVPSSRARSIPRTEQAIRGPAGPLSAPIGETPGSAIPGSPPGAIIPPGPPVQPPGPPTGGIPPPQGPPLFPRRREPRVLTERFALKRSLQRQASAAAQAARATTKELNTLKKQIADNVQKNLPVTERGRFNRVIAAAKTSKDLAKATVRVQNRVDELLKQDLVSGIQKTTRKALESSKVDTQFQDRIKKTIAPFSFKERQPQTLARLGKTQKFLDNQRQNGKDTAMPQRILNDLKVFSQKSIKELNVNELVNLQNKIDLLENLGRQRRLTTESYYNQEKSQRLNDVLQGTQNISKDPLIEAKPGEILTVKDKIANRVARIQNEARRIDLVLSPMDIVFDVMDGLQNYAGPNSRVFKETLDTGFGQYLDDTFKWTDPVNELATSLNMKEQNFERIAIHAYRVQPGGRNYLESGNLTKEDIDSVVLTENEMKVYNAMRKTIEEPYGQVVETMRELYNQNLGKLENYFPVQVDYDAVSDIEVFQRVGDLINAEAFGRRTKTVEKGFTEARKGTKKKIKLNAMDVFNKHMDDVAYLLNMQRDIKMLSEIANSPRYQQAAGDIGGLIVSQHMDTMARKGGGEGFKRIAVLDMLRRNFGAAQLGFKLSSIMIQPTALFDGAAQVGGTYVFDGMRRIVTDPKAWNFMKNNFPELRARVADDPAFRELSHNDFFAGIQEAGYNPLKKADYITASAVTMGAYKRALDQQGINLDLDNPNPQAIKEASKILRRTQSSGFFKDLPQAITRGALTGNRSFDKALLQFKSFMLGRWGQIRHHMWRAGFKNNNPKQGAEVALWLSMATMAEAGIRGSARVILALLAGKGIKGAMDRIDEELEDIPRDVLFETVGNVPFLGDLMRTGMYAVFGSGGSPIPSLSPVIDLPKGVGEAVQFKAPRSKARGVVRTLGAVGTIAGIPGSAQASQIAREALRNKKRRRKKKR